MSLYYSKFYEGAAPAIYQDPNEVGNDLDAIEDAVINGTNKVEDIADAEAGTINGVSEDPLEEAYMLMFECEYNDNLLMQAIGIQEVNEAARGLEPLNEAGKVKEFFKKIKEKLKKMFETITKAFWKLVKKLDLGMANDKKFVASNKQKIIDGSKLEWTLKDCYDIDSERNLELTNSKAVAYSLSSLKSGFDTIIGGNGNMEGADDKFGHRNADDIDETKKLIINQITKGALTDCNSVNEIAEQIKEKIIKDPVEFSNKKDYGWDGNKVCDILSKDRETYKIRESYKDVKKIYADTMKDLDELNAKYEAARKKEETTNRVYVASKISVINELISFEKSAQNVVFAQNMKIARMVRAQARRLANHFLGVYEKNKDKKKAAHESADLALGNTTFSNIQFI